VLDAVIKGDTVKEVLDYVEFDANTLVRKLRHDVELAVREGKIGYEEAGRLLEFYEEGLQGYTYLEEPRERRIAIIAGIARIAIILFPEFNTAILTSDARM
jgi:arginine decarboxylase